jgi:hypothetical protein
MNERTSMTTGTDRQTDPAVMQAVTLPTPATPRAKNTTAARAMAEVNLIANESPCWVASISAFVSLAAFSIGARDRRLGHGEYPLCRTWHYSFVLAEILGPG